MHLMSLYRRETGLGKGKRGLVYVVWWTLQDQSSPPKNRALAGGHLALSALRTFVHPARRPLDPVPRRPGLPS